VRGYTANTRSNYSDVQLTIDEVTCEENTMTLRWTFQATRTELSPTTDVPGAGTPVSFTGCSISHWLGDKIVEEWEHADYLGLQRQLGVRS
jgi:predicted ester cyclase